MTTDSNTTNFMLALQATEVAASKLPPSFPRTFVVQKLGEAGYWFTHARLEASATQPQGMDEGVAADEGHDV